ncbi:MAG TPA: hypothetical protein EYN06_04100 [Myxococcales bacterium]|nr:hypothetical protein [Myxococcales bacterium]HIN85643.1 hypothetical protein [Myxococcales bacterium]
MSQFWIPVILSVIVAAIGALLFFKSKPARLKAFATLLLLPMITLALFYNRSEPLEATNAVDQKPSPESYTRPSLNLLNENEHAAPIPDEAAALRSMLAGAKALQELQWPDSGKVYTPISLWNRIDGAAEVYKRFGLRRALFATAQIDGNDIEIQLYHLGSKQNASAYFVHATKDSPGQTLDGVGDRALLWQGGGELSAGSIYAKVVLTTGLDIQEVKESPKVVLTALGNHKKPSKANSQSTTKETEKNTPNATNSQQLGLDAKLVKYYGVQSTKVTGTIRNILFNDMAHAAAFLGAIRPRKNVKRLHYFGFEAPDQAALSQGKEVFWATGKNARNDVLALLSKAPSPTLPGVASLKKCSELLVQLNGWSGRAYLGPTTVCRYSDGREVFVAQADDSAMTQLKDSFEGIQKKGNGILMAEDPYVGRVFLGRKGQRVVGAAGYEKHTQARKIIEQLLAQ